MNRYAFAKGDPIDRVDPKGHFSLKKWLTQNPLSYAFGAMFGISGLPTDWLIGEWGIANPMYAAPLSIGMQIISAVMLTIPNILSNSNDKNFNKSLLINMASTTASMMVAGMLGWGYNIATEDQELLGTLNLEKGMGLRYQTKITSLSRDETLTEYYHIAPAGKRGIKRFFRGFLFGGISSTAAYYTSYQADQLTHTHHTIQLEGLFTAFASGAVLGGITDAYMSRGNGTWLERNLLPRYRSESSYQGVWSSNSPSQSRDY